MDLGGVLQPDPGRARTTISQRDITAQDLREDALQEIWEGLADGSIDPLTIPDSLMRQIGLGWILYKPKGVKVAAEEQARKAAQQNAARVRIREVCCK